MDSQRTAAELHKAQKQVAELMNVNAQWDLEYREQEEAFRRYRVDSQRAQAESQSLIARVKQEKEDIFEENRTLKFELDRANRQIKTLSERIRVLEQAGPPASPGGGYGGPPVVSVQKLKEIEEESALLRQQLKAYQEDFEAERRDRERMSDEKQSSALKYEAEITSLRLQLDRCRNELSHYVAESNRLAQQLRLKNEYEQDQYKKHLESRGYVSRSPGGKLPPLDPFVEVDPSSTAQPSTTQTPNGAHHYTTDSYKQSSSTTSSTFAPPRRDMVYGANILSRGHVVQQTASAPSTGDQSMRVPLSNERRSHTPSPPNVANGYGANYNQTNGGYVMQNGYHVGSNYSVPKPTDGRPKLTNGYQQQPYMNGTHSPVVNGISGHQNYIDSDGVTSKFQEMVVSRDSPNFSQAHPLPPMETKGRYKCPRCARRFERNSDCTDHKARCLS